MLWWSGPPLPRAAAVPDPQANVKHTRNYNRRKTPSSHPAVVLASLVLKGPPLPGCCYHHTQAFTSQPLYVPSWGLNLKWDVRPH